MTRRIKLAGAVVLAAAALAQPAPAQDRPPPGCRWQNGDGGQILACKDRRGYWRRAGDDEIVGYDPPRKPRPKPVAASVPTAATPVAPAPTAAAPAAPDPAMAEVSAPTPAAPDVASQAAPAAATTPPTPEATPAKPGFFAAVWAKLLAWWEGLKAYFAAQF